MLTTEARLRIATQALRQISRNTVKGAPTVSAAVAKSALRSIEPQVGFAPVTEIGVSFIKLDLVDVAL